jgi:hypothetical protein
VVIGSPTNVNAVDNHLSIIIAPNPFTTHAMISIEGDDFNNSELIVYDLCGQVVQRKEFDTNHVRLEKQGLVSGVYFMKITNKSKIIGVRKIVIE